jgi:hypothetical protein
MNSCSMMLIAIVLLKKQRELNRYHIIILLRSMYLHHSSALISGYLAGEDKLTKNVPATTELII